LKTTNVQLVGGLGNQLFGYFAGQYLEKVLGHKVRYLASKQSDRFFANRSSLGDLSVIEDNRPKGLNVQKLKVLLQRQVARLGKLLSLQIPGGKKCFGELGNFETEEIGFDPSIEHIKSGGLVQGYFQTYKYFDRVLEIGHPPVKLRNPSNWYLAMTRRIRIESPIIIHARRGDYANHATTIGVLKTDYYKNALDRISSGTKSTTRVWLFSDDATWAETLADALSDWPTEIINQPKDCPAAEIMMLMAQGSAIVISNSTFSWWAAKLGNIKKVVAPSPWFKSQNEPTDLIPLSWERTDSIWS
jgi:hypothetical protein